MINLLIVYDIDTSDERGRKTLKKIAEKCEGIGIRVQDSVFECELSADIFRDVKKYFSQTINEDTDSIRIYHIGKNYRRKLETIGVQHKIITDSYVY